MTYASGFNANKTTRDYITEFNDNYKTNKMEALFTIKFVDNSELMAHMQSEHIVFGYEENTISSALNKAIIDLKIEESKICGFVYKFSQTSNKVLSFTDHVEEKMNNINEQLIRAL